MDTLSDRVAFAKSERMLPLNFENNTKLNN